MWWVGEYLQIVVAAALAWIIVCEVVRHLDKKDDDK